MCSVLGNSRRLGSSRENELLADGDEDGERKIHPRDEEMEDEEEEEEDEEEEEEEEEEEDDEGPLNLASAATVGHPGREGNQEYFLPFKKLGMSESAGSSPRTTKKRGLPGFSIDDILSHKTAAIIKQQQAAAQAMQDGAQPGGAMPIVRPWDSGEASSSSPEGPSANRRRNPSSNDDSSPLDALFQMASKTFEGLKAKSELDHAQLSFSNKQPPKKKRKSRTAFTNHQIFELEKRFLYQKYLSPADRDEIASHLGLSNAQVITWFQNRRAKLKRDMEELRKDVECTSQVIPHHPGLAVAAAAMAQRSLSSPTKFGLNHHHSPHHPHLSSLHASPPPGASFLNSMTAASAAAVAAANSHSPGRLSSSSPPPRSEGDRSSPQIRVTDSDG